MTHRIRPSDTPEFVEQEPCGKRVKDRKGEVLGFCTREIGHDTKCTHVLYEKPPLIHYWRIEG